MFAPPIATASSSLPPPCPRVFKQPMEKALVSESTTSQLIFPNEFPYEFETFSSAFSSPGDSTETEEEDETSDDEDNFLAGLTRRLSTPRLLSPPLPSNKSEMKLDGIGSPNGPFPQEDSLKVISAAAGEVAKLIDSKPISRSNQNPNPNSVLPFPYQNAASSHYYYNWLWQPRYFPQCPVLSAPKVSTGTSVLPAPVAVKTPSTGTGVFLPRINPNPSDSRKKSGGGGLVKDKTKVVQQQKRNVEEV